MINREIEIYINFFDAIYIEKMCKDFFNKDKTPAYPIYILNPFQKPLIVEASKKEEGDGDNIPLARIYSKSYPPKRILIIEGIEGREEHWGKVVNFARELINQMIILDFGVGLIKPEGLFVEAAAEETKKFNKAPIITQAKVLPAPSKNSTKDELDSSLANNLADSLSMMELNTSKTGKYGTDRSLSTSDVMQIVKRYIGYKENNTEGSRQEFYNALPSHIQSKFKFGTLKKWTLSERFQPVEEKPTRKPTR